MAKLSNDNFLVFLVRHGTTILNEKNAFRGPIDVPLDKNGFRDAYILANLFEPIEIGYIVTSDKLRSVQTAKIIGDKKGIIPIQTEALRALDVGDLGGKERSPENIAIINYHTLDHPEESFPGGESLNDFRERVRPVLCEAIDEAMATGLPILLVVHSSIVHEAGVMAHGSHTATLVEPGGVAALSFEDGKLRAEPIFKPDLKRMHKKDEPIT
jgi:broad specificity phosphatase PhoE